VGSEGGGRVRCASSRPEKTLVRRQLS
jgi:hypothetical protein